MKRFLLIVAFVGSLALAAAGVVLADSGSITDPKGDVKHNPSGKDANYDIVKATYGHARHRKLKHTVTVAGHLGSLTSPGPGAYPDMLFDVPGNVGDNPNCDYFIQPDPPGTPYNHTDHIKFNVYRCKNEFPNPPVGSARGTRVRPDTDKLVFSKKVIGSPKRYGWAFDFVTETNNGFAIADRAPNHGFKVHHLG